MFDLTKNRVEANDLAAKEPQRARELAAKFEAYAKRAKVEDWPIKAGR